MSYTMTVQSPEQTEELAMRLASLLQPGDLLTLEGDLGAGKTTFLRRVAHTLCQTHSGELPDAAREGIRSRKDISFEQSDHWMSRTLSILVKLSWEAGEVVARARTLMEVLIRVLA